MISAWAIGVRPSEDRLAMKAGRKRCVKFLLLCMARSETGDEVSEAIIET